LNRKPADFRDENLLSGALKIAPKVNIMQTDLKSNGGEQNQVGQVMLVEDEIIVALDIQQRLDTLGYQLAAHATTGEEAFRFASEMKLDLILMDIKLKGQLDGIDTAAQIRVSSDVPIIYITAFADKNTLERARLTEAYGYLIKPFEDRDLQSTIEMALYKYKIEKKLRESEERYALAVRATNDGIWDWNLIEDKVVYTPRWANMLGLDYDQLTDSPDEWLNRLHPEDKPQIMQVISAHLQGVTPSVECEYRILHQDGGFRWMLCRGLALFDKQKKPGWPVPNLTSPIVNGSNKN
jgi:PAS domain S-box-containing protein